MGTLVGMFIFPLHGCNKDVPEALPFGELAGSGREPVETLTSATKASVILGGRLYDNWPKINSAIKADANPLAKYIEGYPALVTTDKPPKNTTYGDFLDLARKDQYRCTTCHGFDYSGSQFFPVGIMDASNNKTIDDLKAIISGGFGTPTLHAFNSDLNATQIEDLAEFIKYGVVNVSDYIYGLPIGKGDASNGGRRYEGSAGCSGCHGLDGKDIDFANGDPKILPNAFVGTIGQDRPAEMLHKIRFAQPGSKMPSIYESGLTTQDAVDIMTYTQQLARE